MKSIKKMLITFLVVCLTTVGATGCFNKDVIVVNVNGKPITKQLYYINLWSTLRGLESMQEGYWDFENLLGQSPEDFAKMKSLQAVTRCVIFEQKAEELDIKLTKEDTEKIKSTAKETIKEQEAFAREYGISQKDYEKYYTYGVLKEKVVDKLASIYEPNDEEILNMLDEMKANGDYLDEAEVNHILFLTKDEQGNDLPEDKKEEAYEKATQALEKALSGESMDELVEAYKGTPYVSGQIGKEHFSKSESFDEALNRVIFEESEVGIVFPQIVETSMGYELIQVEERTIESQEEMKERATQKVKKQYAEKELEEMASVAEVEKTEAYDTVGVDLLGTAKNDTQTTKK